MRALALLLALALLGWAAPAHAEDVRLGGVRVHLREGTEQVVTVKQRRGWHARVSLWRLTDAGWQRRLTAYDGRTGYGGLVRGSRRVQGSGTTPLGSYRLLSAFGTHRADDAWALPYRRIRRGDYWVQDNRSEHYNRYRNRRQGGFRWWLRSGPNVSERLTDYPRQYEWAIVTGFNRRQVRHRGSGIFVHVNGRGATAGCVSAPRWLVRALMARLDPELEPMVGIRR